MSKLYEKLETCLASVRKKTDFKPEVALILGSGLGDFADEIKIEATVDYTDIEGFPTSTVAGHKGRFVFGYVGSVPVVIMQGRVHYYEGYPMTDVVLPTRLMGMMGAKKLILTNAAGGANPEYKPGDFMMITDHITTGVPSPLIGENIDELGARFPDMSEVYSLRLQDVIRKCADKCGVKLQEGVYVQFTGPNYETPAEVRLAQKWGGDAAGISKEELNHKEVQETADRVAKSFKELITEIVTNMYARTMKLINSRFFPLVERLFQLLYKLIGQARPKHTIMSTSNTDMARLHQSRVSHRPAKGSTGLIPLNALRPMSFSTIARTVS